MDTKHKLAVLHGQNGAVICRDEYRRGDYLIATLKAFRAQSAHITRAGEGLGVGWGANSSFNWDYERDYRRRLLEPAVNKRVVLFGRYAASNRGGYDGKRYKKGNVCFTDIRPFNPHQRMGLLCHHLNLTYENLVDEGIYPEALDPGGGYILAGIIRRYGEGRYGLQVDPDLTLPPVSKRGPFDCAYLRIAQSPMAYDFGNLAS